MTLPLISVVIPVFNAKNYISKALDTVFAQHYRPIDIVIVDDGSSDGSDKIIQSYQGLKDNKISTAGIDIRYFYQENSGPSKARNLGIQNSKGDFIAFLDVDDIWNENKLRNQMDLIANNPAIDIIFTNAWISRETGMINFFKAEKMEPSFFGHPYLVKDPLLKLLHINFIHTSSLLSRKTCFEKNLNFNEDRKYAEDWELWLQLSAKKYCFAYLSEPCVIKQEDGAGLTSHKSKMVCSIIDVLDSFWSQTVKERLTKGDIQAGNQIVSQRYKWLGYSLLLSGNFLKARRLYMKSFFMNPQFSSLLGIVRTFGLRQFNRKNDFTLI